MSSYVTQMRTDVWVDLVHVMFFFFLPTKVRCHPISSNPILSNPISSNKKCKFPILSKFCLTFVRVAWRGLKGEASAFHNRDQFLEYFQDNWIERNYPVRIWNMHSLDGPRTNNNAKGWHSKDS